MSGILKWLKTGPPKKIVLISLVGTTVGVSADLPFGGPLPDPVSSAKFAAATSSMDFTVLRCDSSENEPLKMPAAVDIAGKTRSGRGPPKDKDTFRGVEYKSDVKCNGKVAIVTGGNSGIGKETAKELARRGGIVYLLCRDKQRCDRARKEIILSTKNKYVYSRECDLGSLSSVRKFAEQFLKEEERLDILINNAGVWRTQYEKTKDGFEIHLGVNHMGHFFLTNLLLDLLKKSAPSRIINVSSASHAKGEISKDDLNSENNYSKLKAYNQSKLANILFTKELTERLKGTGVTANAVHPGYSSTYLYRLESSGFASGIGNMLVQPFLWIFLKTPIGGAQTVLYAALNPDLEKVSGKYFVDCVEQEVAPQAKDDFTAKWLWAVSEKWTRLKEVPRDNSGNVVFS